MRRALACILVMLASAAAHADGEKVLVLRAEGRADKQLRTRIEGAVLKLAQTGGQMPTPGDVTYGDAAMMVGCKAEETQCKAEVLGMLAVDEIVTITATPKPGGVEVAVRRITRGGVTRNAATLVTPDKAEQLDALAPLFGGVPAVTSPPPQPVAAPVIAPPPIAAAATTTATLAPGPGPVDEPEHPGGNRRLAMFGMAGGGALLVVGIVFWASAAGIEGDIEDAPKNTRDELEHVKDLEAEGDGYATAGNLLVLGGLVLGGVSTYYFWKSTKRAPSRSARVTPIFGNGTGIAITWGGSL